MVAGSNPVAPVVVPIAGRRRVLGLDLEHSHRLYRFVVASVRSRDSVEKEVSEGNSGALGAERS